MGVGDIILLIIILAIIVGSILAIVSVSKHIIKQVIPRKHSDARCEVCGHSLESVRKFKVYDGMVCQDCIEAAGWSTNGAMNDEFKSKTVKELRESKQYREENAEQIKAEFEETRRAFDEQIRKDRACPICGSDNVAHARKPFSIGKAAAGGLIAGRTGMLIGFLGADKKSTFVCHSCGYQWKRVL